MEEHSDLTKPPNTMGIPETREEPVATTQTTAMNAIIHTASLILDTLNSSESITKTATWMTEKIVVQEEVIVIDIPQLVADRQTTISDDHLQKNI